MTIGVITAAASPSVESHVKGAPKFVLTWINATTEARSSVGCQPARSP